MSLVKIEISIPEEHEGSEPACNPKTGECYLFGIALANQIRQRLIDENLTTNGHISQTYNTSYKWEGKMYERDERTLTLKTEAENAPQIARIVTDLHPYKTVPITMTDIHSVGLEYDEWIKGHDEQIKDQEDVPEPE